MMHDVCALFWTLELSKLIKPWAAGGRVEKWNETWEGGREGGREREREPSLVFSSAASSAP